MQMNSSDAVEALVHVRMFTLIIVSVVVVFIGSFLLFFMVFGRSHCDPSIPPGGEILCQKLDC